jgi:uncharacterized protein YfaT (DUF1175 family)
MVLLAVVLGASALAAGVFNSGQPAAPVSALRVAFDRDAIPADGISSARLAIQRADGRRSAAREVAIRIVEGERRARLESVFERGDEIAAVVRAGILPGPVTIEVAAAGAEPARVRLNTVLDASDRDRDGTPDFLLLDRAADREAFRRWFTFLAEMQAFLAPRQRPREINDCAALLRFAYRESLREHHGEGASALRLSALPEAPSVEKYRYPFTPLGADLFRVRPGRFSVEDLSVGAFAQFADAETLRRLNTHRVSRNLHGAQPGDLLFYRQLEQNLPDHVMIFLGPSQVEPGSGVWVVYHTGPEGDAPGEVRRVREDELLRHPAPQWRPVSGNPNFLGVYRWNILREAGS